MKKKEIKNDVFHLVNDGWYCAPSLFTVKGIKASESDFGETGDRDPANAEKWSCADMHFTPKLATQEVLDKYGITVDEYNEIAQALEDVLSFGHCGLCV